MVSRHAKYLTALALAAFVSSYEASEHKGQVRVGEVPIPGAVVVAKQGDKAFRAVTDSSGSYAFPDLADGSWIVRVEMAGFETEQLEVAASRDAEIVQWNLKMLPMSGMTETATPGFSISSVSATDVADGAACGRSAGSTSHQRKRQQWRINTLRAGGGFRK